MDEILASIRKIIESNDIGGPGQPANDPGLRHDAMPGQRADEVHLTIEDDLRLSPFDEDAYEVPANSAPRFAAPAAAAPPQAAAPAASQPAAPANPPLSLADVAARVRAASERSVAARVETAEPALRPVAAQQPAFVPAPNVFAPASPSVPVVGLEPARAAPAAGGAFAAFERSAGAAPAFDPPNAASRSYEPSRGFEKARIAGFEPVPEAHRSEEPAPVAFAPVPSFQGSIERSVMPHNNLDLPFDEAMALRQPAMRDQAVSPAQEQDDDFHIVTDRIDEPTHEQDLLDAAADAFEAELHAHDAAEPEEADAHASGSAESMPRADLRDMMDGIISPVVGEHVAHAFEQLAIAVDRKPRRSFDEIAEDMLRPMLQEWMDDNLPSLVERLVREEIERVARGPRR
ncbi:hypothetical protein BJF93_10540 [Xaviernesmea oryzae]|uniref:DUF2497 domain-containing protein n=1 Tax=Xaviernesmea oryzae TaxID=464029 RepID=A0A1Q9AX39_9HYPH|nr:hypothetical protein BJF93_10540 [Xaviernesmea oryzae]